ncbi:MAG: RloB domain-containing protein [Ignavibacteriales bacterium]|nr:RloB domain-containing protein [Ignavibacteriales bacterium]
MGFKRRGYSREVSAELARDYKLFVIACEGAKREREYFEFFERISDKIKVDVIDEITQGKENFDSAPVWVLDRAVKYVDKLGLSDEDELWFVMDIDRWKPDQLREIYMDCEKTKNWNLALSNPCFEVWLYFHKKKEFSGLTKMICKEIKHQLSTLESGGYSPEKFIPDVFHAIQNAKESDSNPGHYSPEILQTKVYHLAEALLKKIGLPAFNAFITRLQKKK